MRKVALIVAVAACSPTVGRFNLSGAVSVSAITPAAVVRGVGCATLTGHGLGDVTAANVGGQSAARVRVASDTVLSVCPSSATPLGAATIELVGPAGSSTLSERLSIIDTPLAATLSASKAKPGDQLTLNGNGFDALNASNNQETIGGTPAQVVSVLANSLIVAVPSGAASGPVSVTLVSADPAPTAASAGALTIIQPFTIAAVLSADVVGLYGGTNAEVDVSVLANEIAVGSPVVTVDGAPVTVLPSSSSAQDSAHALIAVLPAGLSAASITPHQICVQGDLSAPCAALPVLGPGHSELGRVPSCYVNGPAQATGPAHWSPDETNSDTTYSEEQMAVLDDATDRVFIFDDTYAFLGAYTLPPGHYTDFVMHAGCNDADAAPGYCARPSTQGYIATIDQDAANIVIVPFLSGRTISFPPPGTVDALVPLTSTTLALFYHTASSDTFTCVLDLVNGMCATSLALNAPLVAVTPTNDRNSGLRDRNGLMTVLGSSPPSWEFVSYGGATPQALANLPDSNLVPGTKNSLRWAAYDGTAAGLFAPAGFGVFTPLEHTGAYGANILFAEFTSTYAFDGEFELAPEYLGGGAGQSHSHAAEPVISSYDAINGVHWVSLWGGEPDIAGIGDAFFGYFPIRFDSLAQIAFHSIPLPAGGTYSNLDGFHPNCTAGTCQPSTICGASTPCSGFSLPQLPSGETWLNSALKNDDDRRMGVFAAGSGLFVEEHWSSSPVGLMESLTDVLPEDLGTGTVISNFGRPLLWDGHGVLSTLDPSYGTIILSTPLSSGRPKLSRRGNRTGVRVSQPSAFRTDQVVAKLFDAQASDLTAFVSGASDVTALDADGTEQIIAAPGSTPLSVRLTPLADTGEGVARELPLSTLSSTCVVNAASTTPAAPMLSVLGEGETYAVAGLCIEKRQPVQACPNDDPVQVGFQNPFDPRNPSQLTCPFHSFFCGGLGTAFNYCRNSIDLELWLPQTGGASPSGIATGLCGESASLLQTFPTRTPNQRLVIWQVVQPFIYSGCAPTFPAHVVASLLDISSSLVVNLTEPVFGTSAFEISEVGSPTTALVRDDRYARWLYARGSGGGSEIVSLDETMSATVVATSQVAFSQLELSADQTLFYALSSDGLSISIYKNAATPILSHVTTLNAAAAAMRMTGDGSALMASVADGYCVLGD